MSRFGVSQFRDTELSNKMKALHILEKDIDETFIHSSGPGGQNVNKVATCVHLKHRPTGMSVKYQKERTQGLNRFKARCLLIEKIEQKQQEVRAKVLEELRLLSRISVGGDCDRLHDLNF